MTTTKQVYEYRTPRSAAIWIIIAILCVLGIAWGFNYYRLQAISQMESLAESAKNFSQRGEIAPRSALQPVESGQSASDIQPVPTAQAERQNNPLEVVHSWSWVKENCEPHAKGGFNCMGHQVVAIDSDGGLMIVTGESQRGNDVGWDVISLRTDKTDWIRKESNLTEKLGVSLIGNSMGFRTGNGLSNSN